MLTLMREMSVISVSVLSNQTSSLTRPLLVPTEMNLLVPTEMNLDNATTHHLLRFNKSNQFKKCKKLRWVAEPSDKKCKKTSVEGIDPTLADL